jgi:hypothetical protein
MSGRGTINGEAALSALRRVGAELGAGPEIEILVIGGAAAHLLGLLPPAMTTSDVDAVHFRPTTAVDEVLQAAVDAAEKLRLPRGWFNHDDAGPYANALPGGWDKRRVEVGLFGRLRVFALGRRDLIAMKFYAHRQVDIEHLAFLAITASERAFTRRYLRRLSADQPAEREKVAMALHVLAHWRTKA